jgi:excisionase family DNA binding protein
VTVKPEIFIISGSILAVIISVASVQLITNSAGYDEEKAGQIRQNMAEHEEQSDDYLPEGKHVYFMSVQEAADYLRLPPEQLIKHAQSREIPAEKISGEWRFLRADLDAWSEKGN